MWIPLDTVAALSNEGINTVDDLEGIYPEDIGKDLKDLSFARSRCCVGVTSQKHHTNACNMVRYYHATNRDISIAMMCWKNPTGRNFELQWKALQQVKDEDDSDVPKISKSFTYYEVAGCF